MISKFQRNNKLTNLIRGLMLLKCTHYNQSKMINQEKVHICTDVLEMFSCLYDTLKINKEDFQKETNM